MADSRLQTGPRFLEPHLRQRVSEKTFKNYRDELLPFSVWSLERQYHPETAEEWETCSWNTCTAPRLEPSKIPYASGWSRVLLSEVPQSTVMEPWSTLGVGNRGAGTAHSAAGQGSG